MHMRVHAAADVSESLPQKPWTHEEGQYRVEPARRPEEAPDHREKGQDRIRGARDRFLGLGREPLAVERVARLPFPVADERHAERREDREAETEETGVRVRAAGDLDDPA